MKWAKHQQTMDEVTPKIAALGRSRRRRRKSAVFKQHILTKRVAVCFRMDWNSQQWHQSSDISSTLRFQYKERACNKKQRLYIEQKKNLTQRMKELGKLLGSIKPRNYEF